MKRRMRAALLAIVLGAAVLGVASPAAEAHARRGSAQWCAHHGHKRNGHPPPACRRVDNFGTTTTLP